MAFVEYLSNLIQKRKNSFLNCCKCSGNDRRFVVRYYNPIKNESILTNDPANSMAIGYAHCFDEFVWQKHLCALNDCSVNICRTGLSVFKSRFSDIDFGENKLSAFITSNTDGVISLLANKHINTIMADGENRNLLYIINQKDMPHFENTNDGVYVSLEYMRDTKNRYVLEAKNLISPGRLEQYRNDRLLVIEPFLDIVYNSNAQVLKIIFDENGTDTIESINNFINHL
jgi:hypothetical protein